jgi:hypothetical protein
VFGVLRWLKGFCLVSDIRLFASGLLIASSRAFFAILCGDSASKLKTFTQSSFDSLALTCGLVYGVVIKPQTLSSTAVNRRR